MRTLSMPYKKKSEYSDDISCSDYILTLMHSRTSSHLLHLTITGDGSYAAHKALNSYYDDIVDFIDDISEQYQGAFGKILDFGQCNVKCAMIRDISEMLEHLEMIHMMSCKIQEKMKEYSEIVNTIDELKSLINKTKYKLKFLK